MPINFLLKLPERHKSIKRKDTTSKSEVLQYRKARVLVKQVSFDGKHKLADTWEKVPYVVVDQVNSEIPVFNVTREDDEYFTETYYYLWDLSENRKFYQKNQNQFQDHERDNRSQYR
jgi:hypothetical protein